MSEVDRLNRVVNEFLDYARPAPLKREPVMLSALLDSCLELLAPVILAGRPDHRQVVPAKASTR